MATPKIHQPRAAMPVKKTKIKPILAAARAIYLAMLAEIARFPSPIPALVLLLAQITALDLAEQAMGTGKAATAARNAALDVLWASLLSLRSYVQTVANADEANSVVIIKSAAFDVAATATHTKPILAAKPTGVPGAVKLLANATLLSNGTSERPTFNWQYSVDGGHTWISVAGTPTASTVISGLPVAANCSFRVSVTQKASTPAWSQAVTILVS